MSSPDLSSMQGFQGDEELAHYFQVPVSDRDLWRSGTGRQVLGIASSDCSGPELFKLAPWQPAELERPADKY